MAREALHRTIPSTLGAIKVTLEPAIVSLCASLQAAPDASVAIAALREADKGLDSLQTASGGDDLSLLSGGVTVQFPPAFYERARRPE